MDVRAFGGSFYPYSANLPYVSGFIVNASGQSTNFPACRALYINDGGSSQDLQIILADSPGTPITIRKISPHEILPVSATTISGAETTASSVIVLY